MILGILENFYFTHFKLLKNNWNKSVYQKDIKERYKIKKTFLRNLTIFYRDNGVGLVLSSTTPGRHLNKMQSFFFFFLIYKFSAQFSLEFHSINNCVSLSQVYRFARGARRICRRFTRHSPRDSRRSPGRAKSTRECTRFARGKARAANPAFR